MLNWKSMESAPRDLTRVLLMEENGAMYFARFDIDFRPWEGRHDVEEGEGAWVIFDCDDGFYTIICEKPIAWCSLDELR